MALRQPRSQAPEKVDTYFEADAAYWRDVYGQPGATAEVYRDRLNGARDWIDALSCAPGDRALDVGCGAGFLAVAMAHRGFRVDAIDTSRAMVDLTRQTVAAAAMPEITVAQGDACELGFADASFDLVIAIAVLPWVARAEPVIAEIARVLKPGGHAIVSADNRARLTALLDPKYNPALAPLRESIKAALVRGGLRQPSHYPNSTFHRRRFVDEALAREGLLKVKSRTIGFGAFTLLGRVMIPEPAGTRLHRLLQRRADRGMPLLRATGGHYLVLAQKVR